MFTYPLRRQEPSTRQLRATTASAATARAGLSTVFLPNPAQYEAVRYGPQNGKSVDRTAQAGAEQNQTMRLRSNSKTGALNRSITRLLDALGRREAARHMVFAIIEIGHDAPHC